MIFKIHNFHISCYYLNFKYNFISLIKSLILNIIKNQWNVNYQTQQNKNIQNMVNQKYVIGQSVLCKDGEIKWRMLIFAKKFNIVPESSHVISYKTDVKTETLNNDNYITGIKMSIMQYNVAKRYEIQCVGSSSVSAEESIDVAIKSCIERSEKEKFEEFFPQ